MDLFHTDCIKSYFQIATLVNRGIEPLFFIEDKKLYLGTKNKQKIYLCIEKDFWYPGAKSGHNQLEFFICTLLNARKPEAAHINTVIKANLFKASE